MILIFKGIENIFYLVDYLYTPATGDIEKLSWLFGNASLVDSEKLEGLFIGPRSEMITPWSTNAVEITQNMGITGIRRIEEFYESEVTKSAIYDPMLQALYSVLDEDIFSIVRKADPILYIDNIAAYNLKEGLALSEEEINYLDELSKNIGRKLTDSEIFGFSQVNSEHCRHKIFNGKFVIDGIEQDHTLFQLIKQTTETHPNRVVSAYKDNCAFIEGPSVEQFAPETQDKADYFKISEFKSVLSLKAETHNFPTTVEPFNGAATGSGGEIRDRVGGGKGAYPLAGTAVYMTSYPRLDKQHSWESKIKPRHWLYHSPDEILIKASNGASDFGNKFGQPLICGSVLTFEHQENGKTYGYDKVIMLAGGIGYGKKTDSLKDIPQKGDKIVLLGGDNYRIGMGGGAVSSVATGEYANAIELNAVQRSNPEMQKRVCNAIRAMAEAGKNPIVSIHDHGAGGHLNCLSELVEQTGGVIHLDSLPIGDPTLSAKEIIGNESQERMGLVLKEKDLNWLKSVAERERAPMYIIGDVTDDHQFVFENRLTGEKPIDLRMESLFGKPPRTIMNDNKTESNFKEPVYNSKKIPEYISLVLQLESVACKDWLTNKVDRCVTGKVALQQSTGAVQLPLNNLGVAAIDYQGKKGIATALGHAPVAALIDPSAGSVLSIAEALTNLIWAPIEGGLIGVSLSANWMWPCRNAGEDARLYEAVRAASDFSLALSINIPTGKDSLSMTQKYPEGDVVYSPGTVIISASGEVKDIRKTVKPVLKNSHSSSLLYIDFSSSPLELGGTSFAQALSSIGKKSPKVTDPAYFKKVFNEIQDLIDSEKILAGHDISSGGMITCLLELCFTSNTIGLQIDLSEIPENDLVKILFSENPGIIIQVENVSVIQKSLAEKGIKSILIGHPVNTRKFSINHKTRSISLDIYQLRDKWFQTSYLLDRKQCGDRLALERFQNYKKLELKYNFPKSFKGKFSQYGIEPSRRTFSGLKAAIIREKGVNGDREMAWMMHLAGLDVKDIHMTDLISGRETLEDIQMIVFVGGFSNSDVLGSAKGWAGAFLYNEKAKLALDKFYARPDTLSLGVCNGCQLMIELGLVTPEHESKPRMKLNASNKFECIFTNVDVPENNSVLLKTLSATRLGIWVAHGEGRFTLPYEESRYNVVMKFSYPFYPGNPNGSDYDIAGICSSDGRHLVMMPHLERAIYPWNWAYYPDERKDDEISPWIEAFINAREWIKTHKK
jgi:phosphoribosylformylglycinamidine synthase